MNTPQIKIYGQPNCKFCKMAKAFLEQLGMEYSYTDILTDDAKADFRARFPGATTVPQIIVNGDWIGGYDQLVDHAKEYGWT